MRDPLPRDLGEIYGNPPVEEGERRLKHVGSPPQLFAGGDTLYVPISGGAGYGDVLERDRRA